MQARLRQIEQLLRSDPARAEALAAEFLAAVPGHQMALLFHGIASRLAGNLDTAIDILTLLSASSPDAPLVHLQLGLALRGSGRNEDALQSMRRAVTVKPDFSDAWLALADLLTALGDRSSADEAFTMYVRHSANDPHLREPAAALRENRVADAENQLRKHVEQHPTDIVSLCLLADVAERNDRMKEAEELLERCPGTGARLQACAPQLRGRTAAPEQGPGEACRRPAACLRMILTIRTCASCRQPFWCGCGNTLSR